MASEDTDRLELQKLRAGEPAYVEFYYVERSGCCGMGGGLEYSMSSSRYFGVISRKVLDEDGKRLNLFAKGRFVNLDGNRGPYLFGITDEGGFKVDNYYLKKTEIVEFSDKEDLSYKIQLNYFSNYRRGEHYNQSAFLRMYIYTGEREVLYDKITSRSNPFLSKEIFDKIGLDLSTDLLRLLKEKSAADMIALFKAVQVKSREDVKAMLEAAKKNGVDRYVKEVDIMPGVKINVEKFLEGVEAKITDKDKAKSVIL